MDYVVVVSPPTRGLETSSGTATSRCQQAAPRVSEICTRAGSSRRHRSSANGHLGLNGQPCVAAPSVAKSVTLEVDTVAAQKLGLAASLGSLSLMLRKAGDTASAKSLRVSLKDLFDEVVTDVGAVHASTTVISIKRGGAQKEDYSVPIEAKDRHASADSVEGRAVH